jgi:hypothetical protein
MFMGISERRGKRGSARLALRAAATIGDRQAFLTVGGFGSSVGLAGSVGDRRTGTGSADAISANGFASIAWLR